MSHSYWHGGASLHNITATLIVIARNHLQLDQVELDKMRRIKKKASIKHKGMTAKNSKRLMQFNEPYRSCAPCHATRRPNAARTGQSG
jgi:hypothetical protein